MKPESPVNAIPPVVIALTAVILVMEAVLQLADFGYIGGPKGLAWRLNTINELGFSTGIWDAIVERGDYRFDRFKRFVTYPYVNAAVTQVAFCAALTLALGKFVAEFYGGFQMLVIYVVASAFGAVMFGLLAWSTFPLYGGFPPVYGLIGAYTYAIWLRLVKAGENQILAFRLIGVLLLIQLIYGVVFGFVAETPPPPTWIAELSGFAGGFGVAILLAPGGWRRMLDRMRQRA